jgi:hypothetical protein
MFLSLERYAPTESSSTDPVCSAWNLRADKATLRLERLRRERRGGAAKKDLRIFASSVSAARCVDRHA